MSQRYQYLFGPVPSRRFGRSLGIDLVPVKTCTLDCLFCEVGATTHQTAERREYVPTADVIAELNAWLDAGNTADVVTVAGSGEPTLHTGFGEVLRAGSRRGQKTVLLSNGTLMHLPEVRAAAMQADIVKLSLSAWDQESYDRIHQSRGLVEFATLLSSYHQFRQMFRGQLWLEAFFVAGLNDSDDTAERIATLARAVRPDKIHLNTAVRPTAYGGQQTVSEARLRELVALFGPAAEVAASFRTAANTGRSADAATILSTIARRPCTVDQLSASLGIAQRDVETTVRALEQQDAVVRVQHDGLDYLTLQGRDGTP